ncbi:MAG TPA: DNA translocase FtsK, partial [Ruminococcus sp.]|nr:DNA translocase FtsK [Ruminococcus sp.]
MAQKKTTGKTGAKRKPNSSGKRSAPAKKGTKSTSAAKPKTKAAAAAPAEKPEQQKKPQNLQLRSFTICGTGVLLGAFIFYPGTKGWLVFHEFLLGLFGVGALALPFILIGTGWLVGQDRGKDASRRAVWAVLLTLAFSALWQSILGVPPVTVDPETEEKLNFFELTVQSASPMLADGKALRGGGLISGIIVLPLIAIFDIWGARILIFLTFVALVMLVTNRGLPEILRFCAKPFKWLGGGIVHAATRGIEDFTSDFYDEDDDDDDDDDDDYDDEEEPVREYVRSSRRQPSRPADEETLRRSPRRQLREDERHMQDVVEMLERNAENPASLHEDYRNIDVDVDIAVETEPIPEEEMNRLTPDHPSGVDSIKSSNDEDEQFRRLVLQAAEEAETQSNRLPWLSSPANRSDITDESIYEEEPEIPYIAPPLSLLHHADNSAREADITAELTEKGNRLVETLASFGVQVKRTGIRRGPTVTRYEIQPAAGVKIAKITSLADDIGLNLGGKSVRIEAPIPGKPAVGVEVPNNVKDTVSLREILESPEFQQSQSKLSFAVGKDIDGHVIVGDIAKMPHMIIAGTTGSGKSVCTNSIIMSILYHASPDEVRLILVDPKVVEFQPYDGIPHLLIPVVTQPQKAAGALNWAVLEMERRYTLCATYGVRDLKGYNTVAERTPELKKLPQIVIVIDEFADLMMSSGKEVEAAVIRIAQKARAAGIHLIIATQRPTADVITGLIKSNVPSRIGMSVKSSQDSRNILD